MNKPAAVIPGPARVVMLDLDAPLPELTADDRYQTAMVVGLRNRIPRGVVDVDLTSSAKPLSIQLDTLIKASRGAQTQLLSDSELPTISVVVPTIVGRREDLQLLLEGFAKVEYPDVEFILVDNRRSLPVDDPLPELVAGRNHVRVVRELQPGISAARNAGIRAARGEIIAFTDDDVRVEPEWLRAIGTRFTIERDLDAVTGLILPAELETPAQIWFERYYGGFSGERTFAPLTLSARTTSGPVRGSRIVVRDGQGREVRQFSVYGVGAFGAGANMAFRKATLNRLGNFDLALGTGTPARGGEDLAILITILWNGGKVGYEPSAVAHHRHRLEFNELLHQLGGNGLGFTAMLTSLINHDKRHLIGLATQLPLAIFQMGRQSAARLKGIRPGAISSPSSQPTQRFYPRSLVLSELFGYPKGPLAYLRSRERVRTWPSAID